MIFFILAFAAGVAISIQAPINAALARGLSGTPILGACLSFIIGALVLIVVSRFNNELTLTQIKSLGSLEYWKFFGGVLGAFIVFTTTLCAPRIGIAPMTICLLLGQFVAGLFLDATGYFEATKKPIDIEKIIGLILVIFGVGVFFYRDLFHSN